MSEVSFFFFNNNAIFEKNTDIREQAVPSLERVKQGANLVVGHES